MRNPIWLLTFPQLFDLIPFIADPKSLWCRNKKRTQQNTESFLWGSWRIRTAVNGFADRCLPTRLRNHCCLWYRYCFDYVCKGKALFWSCKFFQDYFFCKSFVYGSWRSFLFDFYLVMSGKFFFKNSFGGNIVLRWK